LNQGLQELHLLVKVGVDPCVELGVLGLAHGVSLVVVVCVCRAKARRL
jgi:hypothetical protein